MQITKGLEATRHCRDILYLQMGNPLDVEVGYQKTETGYGPRSLVRRNPRPEIAVLDDQTAEHYCKRKHWVAKNDRPKSPDSDWSFGTAPGMVDPVAELGEVQESGTGDQDSEEGSPNR